MFEGEQRKARQKLEHVRETQWCFRFHATRRSRIRSSLLNMKRTINFEVKFLSLSLAFFDSFGSFFSTHSTFDWIFFFWSLFVPNAVVWHRHYAGFFDVVFVVVFTLVHSPTLFERNTAVSVIKSLFSFIIYYYYDRCCLHWFEHWIFFFHLPLLTEPMRNGLLCAVCAHKSSVSPIFYFCVSFFLFLLRLPRLLCITVRSIFIGL